MNWSVMNRLFSALCIAGLLAPFSPAAAQVRYPSKPIRLVLPYAAGGPTDVVARKYADRMTALLGQPMLVENKGGAEAAIGAADIAHSAPDGYSILFGTSSTHVLTPLLMKDVNYDPVKDFSQIAIYGTQSMVIVVNNDVPARNLAELVSHIRANPGKYSYVSTSSLSRVTANLLMRQAGNIDILEIPYKGSAPGMQDFLSNRVQIYPSVVSSVLSLYKAGRVRILAVASDKRVSAIPDVPTAIESGVPDMIMATFNVVAAPAGTPQAIIDVLARHTATLAQSDAVLKDLETAGLEPVIDANPARVTRYIDGVRARLAPLLKSM